MTYLFSRSNHDRLQAFAVSNMLLAFDFDGTLAPIVSSPGAAAMRASTRQLFKHAIRLYPCVVISGRAESDVRRRLPVSDVFRVVGNHGTEPSPEAGFIRRRVRRWMPEVRANLTGIQGVVIEDKGFSIALHYRKAHRRSAARRAILDVARSLDDARIVGGKLVVNLLVADAPNKGIALERERRRMACSTVVYVGDDETDEDVFRLDRPDVLLSVRVGWSRMSAASCYIRRQQEIDRLLETLAALRRRGHA